jgi:hypothetical protein
VNVSINVQLATTQLRNLALMMDAAHRTELHGAMGEGVREETREHLQELALTRHTTAQRLGAEPTGHLGQAARAVEATPLTTDASGATMTINHPGLTRAFRDVTIVPVNAQFLTIPINALAYGRRVGEFGGRVVLLKEGGHRETSERKRKPIPLDLPVYYLVRSVTQHQDRSLLPSDAEWEDAAREAGTRWFDQQISET